MTFSFLLRPLLTLSFLFMTISPHNSLAKVPAILTQADAIVRAGQVSNVTYQLQYSFGDSSPLFDGKMGVYFTFNPGSDIGSHPLFLDFAEGQIHRLVVNGQVITDHQYNGARIVIPTDKLRIGEKNSIMIEFSHAYSETGSGLHRFKDPADGKTYIYTKFEPYWANRAFPCFDQPDIKATFLASVEGPSDWSMISNTREVRVDSVAGGRSKWHFRQTDLFSTYLFALIAGPYHVWEDSVDGIPLRLFSRESMARYIPHEFWFASTKASFRVLNSLFGVRYPYGKYDQIVVPEFPSGAMENVAAVTFNESYFPRVPRLTPLQLARLDSTTAHEMVHMWFGNLVTMKWWDHLWLNEAFATFVGALVQESTYKALNLPNPWQLFYAKSKGPGYVEDGYRTTTHPIVANVPDTNQGFANFDMITYGKGAAVLKQLYYILGEHDFKAAMKLYFLKFSRKNTTLDDFIGCLQEASGKNLSRFVKEWLQTSGTNSLSADVRVNDGRVESFTLMQSPDPSTGILREHSTQIAFMHEEDDGSLVVGKSIPVTYDGERTVVPAAVGEASTSLILLNAGDSDFVSVIVDTNSVDTLEASLSRVKDPMYRQVYWENLWQMVRNAKFPAQRFARIAMKHLENESDPMIVEEGLADLVASVTYMGDKHRKTYRDSIEDYILKGFLKAAHGSDLQLLWFKSMVQVARTPTTLVLLSQWLDSQTDVNGLELDQTKRWDLLGALAKANTPGIQQRIHAELSRDDTDSGKTSAATAQVSIPELAVKQFWWDKITGEKPGKESPVTEVQLRAVMTYFHTPGHRELTKFAAESYFGALLNIAQNRDQLYATQFAATMFPSVSQCGLALAGHVDAFMATHGGKIPPRASKQVQIHRQKLDLIGAARAFSDSFTN